MRLAFMGTPAFAVPALSELIASGHEVVCVYTQPPRPAGRGHKERPSPVHELAETHGIPVRTPLNFKSDEEKTAFAELELDVAIVVAYGLILPQTILDAPTHGCLNLHGSLLPRWRGAAPVQRAIMAGDNVTGIQVMQMERGLDTGPVLLSETVAIKPDDTSGTLHDTLARIGADMLPRALAALERGALQATPQEEDGVLYADKISSEEARIDWTRPAHEIDCHIRGLSPFPGAWFEIEDQNKKPVRVKALLSTLAESNGPAGSILKADKELHIACGEGAISLLKVQRAGKTAQSAEEFLRGTPLSPGQKVL
jgi:methionyl-tRNA formyltransferase